ncbi:MAG: hypothetical protein K6E62_01915 [Lachnospiraceae bacterium]|nr:hypothetical protein [Lachnospiraceae bacterium]
MNNTTEKNNKMIEENIEENNNVTEMNNNTTGPLEYQYIYARGSFRGTTVAFKRKFAGHYFTDEEVDKLLVGEMLRVENAENGRCHDGHLQKVTSPKGREYYRFVADWDRDYIPREAAS